MSFKKFWEWENPSLQKCSLPKEGKVSGSVRWGWKLTRLVENGHHLLKREVMNGFTFRVTSEWSDSNTIGLMKQVVESV